MRSALRLSAFTARCMLLCVLFTSAAQAQPAGAGAAAALQARYGQLQQQLASNVFQRPLYLDSSEEGGTVKGDIYAVLPYPLSAVRAALDGPTHWCDILILHLNTKYCRLGEEGGKPVLRMQVGKKVEQDLRDTYRVDLRFLPGSSADDYFAAAMRADKGPLGTSDYRINVEAIALDEQRAFLHFSYTYAYGMASKLALRAYLMTAGRDKVGFSSSGHGDGGQPQYIGGSRATVERNTMRYYLAIDAYLASQSLPAAQRPEARLLRWYEGTEQYPRQLREVSRDDYLTMKRHELARQQLPAP